MAHHPAIRRTLLAVALVGALVIAGCGGSTEDETGGVPESGTEPATSTTEAATSGATTTTTNGTSDTEVTLPSDVDAVIQINVQGDNVSVSSVVRGNTPTFDRAVQVALNTPVRIEVTADRTDEVHLHGYDLKADVAPGSPGVIDFVAGTPGLFLIELEDAHQLLAQLDVAG